MGVTMTFNAWCNWVFLLSFKTWFVLPTSGSRSLISQKLPGCFSCGLRTRLTWIQRIANPGMLNNQCALAFFHIYTQYPHGSLNIRPSMQDLVLRIWCSVMLMSIPFCLHFEVNIYYYKSLMRADGVSGQIAFTSFTSLFNTFWLSAAEASCYWN